MDFREHGNEPCGYIKDGEFLDYCQLLKSVSG